ncbi:MAG: penicillin-binding protein [Clostridia bacterium]|nr:penicillin-binding protein [Clostridia bacterium]
MKRMHKILLVIAVVFACALLAFSGYYFYVTKDVTLSKDKLLRQGASITLYDNADLELVSADLSGKQKTNLDSVPVHTQYAFVDTEDKRFFKHNGYDYPRIAKAFIKNLTTRSFGQGASTISQQLIKNTHLTQEKTLKRKLQEWKLTRQLEKRYNKREILENYLSVIYFGHNCFGIRSASLFYFDKEPQELTLGESCILAGLVKSPNNYSPFKHPGSCQKRKITVLNCMLRAGHINEQDKEKAIAEPLPTTPNKHTHSYGYAHHVFDELSELSEQYSIPLLGSVSVKTYCDSTAQAITDEVFSTQTGTDKTIAVIDNHTCGFKAFVSSVGDLKRSPASLLKPLGVFAPALEENLLSPATPILDEKVDFSGYSPQNYDGTFHGYVSARESLANSYNVPAVKTLNALGIKKATTYLHALDLPVDESDYSLALALGGMKDGFCAKQLFSAYTVFPNGGEYQPSAFIRSIQINGKTVYERKTTKKRVFSPDTAYLTTDMLRTAVQTGTAKKLRNLPYPVYAKTGTAGANGKCVDAYVVAFTQKDVVGVWLGNADRSPVPYTGGGEPCNVLYNVQQRLGEIYENSGTPLQAIRQPESVTSLQLDALSYNASHELILADPISPAKYRFCELFKRTNTPTKTSALFSSPSIETPTTKVTDDGIVIQFSPQTLYRYRIVRYCGKEKTVVYDGEYIPEFIDSTAKENTTYTYGVVPYFGKNVGKEIALPKVNTPNVPFTQKEEKKILKKNWWEE